MSCLVLAVTGPAQSWGVAARFQVRDTGTEPSKSGVVGLIAAAQGRRRQADLADLANLRMGVRVDREGSIVRDYHTAMGAVRADGSRNPDAVISRRYYLADAAFLVALEDPNDNLLSVLDAALAAPRWPLFLGRKSFPPAGPLSRGVFNTGLEELLAGHPLVDPSPARNRQRARQLESGEQVSFRTVVEITPDQATGYRHDQPISFEPRRFGPRPVRTGLVNLEAGMLQRPAAEP